MILDNQEIKILGKFVDDHCEQIGKVYGVSDTKWYSLVEKGMIKQCNCCADGKSFQITPEGQLALA